MNRSALRAAVPPLVALVVLLTLWEGTVRLLEVPRWLVPPPSAIGAAGAQEASSLLGAAVTTGRSALVGFGLSAVLGVLVAVLLASSRMVERALYPYTLFLQTVPIVAIAPLLVLWFGPGPRAVAVSSFIVSLFPVIANTLTGLRSVEPSLRDMFRLYGARRLATLWKLELPAAMPHLFTGLRIASGLAVIGAIVGEFVAGFSEGTAGLGILVLAAYRQLRTDLLFAAVLAASGLGLVLFGVVSLTGARLLRRWHPSAQGT
ncbi:ABC transporter, permease protein [Myxococcus xanthus DK 1622]|uniref:ABC transporter, permease protein n=1 Tax=Myxococcus xanthus (strain DK1622) TaxID=246197 RepID=Q1D8I0_MYXXD|nr:MULTISPECIES: ABC transporter permease [Myxococcus]ABF88847.1 ABC transporter, permease protein [Myxococcus xanthus DK 1622]NOJ55571.1 ABC transporter permease [Myxococcus xanthus]QPM82314.1 ABC transporter permease [Myxococcus xanthus]QVW71561.1 ABC transporter permease [Myxococcus xanthus DZ2]QZZ50550.1 Riboflavin transport system permease protein RibX [Myxococcus xanthus]